MTFTCRENSNYGRERCKFKTLMNTKSLLTMASNVLPLLLKQTFPPIVWNLFCRWRSWDQIQATFKKKFYFTNMLCSNVKNHKWRSNITGLLEGSFQYWRTIQINNLQSEVKELKERLGYVENLKPIEVKPNFSW